MNHSKLIVSILRFITVAVSILYLSACNSSKESTKTNSKPEIFPGTTGGKETTGQGKNVRSVRDVFFEHNQFLLIDKALRSAVIDKASRSAIIVEFLTPKDSREPVARLIKALRATPAAPRTLNDIRNKTYIIGALGRLKAQKAVPMLEALYKQQSNKKSLLAISIAWALEQITGREYGPDYDPWMQAKS